jgi:DNA-binding response OmpR family regulator
MPQTDVVLIDDDPMIRFLVQEYLTAFNYKVATFENGATALEGLKETDAKVILLDLQMPMMNGFEVLENLRNNPSLATTPVIMLSANASDAAHMSTIQPDAYLEKPFQMDALLRAVSNATEKR